MFIRKRISKGDRKKKYLDDEDEDGERKGLGEEKNVKEKEELNNNNHNPEPIFPSDSARYRGIGVPTNNTHRELLVEARKEIKKEFECSQTPLKMEDVSFMTPPKSEENRGNEEIAEEAKSQEAKMIFMRKM